VRAVKRGASGLPSERRFDYPASARLKKRADYQRVYNHGVRVPGRFLVLFLVRAEESKGRFGVTASRRVGGAVVRSRSKRRLRELYRLHARETMCDGIDLVANARAECAKASWVELESEFLRCLRRGTHLLTKCGQSPDGN